MAPAPRDLRLLGAAPVAGDGTPTRADSQGTYLEPYEIDDLQIQVGQRYSVLIETMDNPNQTE